jgi:hypothetical protein
VERAEQDLPPSLAEQVAKKPGSGAPLKIVGILYVKQEAKEEAVVAHEEASSTLHRRAIEKKLVLHQRRSVSIAL